jgi:hypothetical protein
MEDDMAALLILAGGLIGFATALASLLLTELGLGWALAIWSGTGLAFVGIALALALRPAVPQTGTGRADAGQMGRAGAGSA